MIKKDLIFAIMVILWLIVGLTEVILTSIDGISYTSMVFMSIMIILVIFKETNKKFAEWLESNV